MINSKGNVHVEIDKVIHNDLWQFSFRCRRREQFSSSSNNSPVLLHDLTTSDSLRRRFAAPLYLTIAAWPRNAHVNFILPLHSAIKLTAKNIRLHLSDASFSFFSFRSSKDFKPKILYRPVQVFNSNTSFKFTYLMIFVVDPHFVIQKERKKEKKKQW